MEGLAALRELTADLQMLAVGLAGIDANPQFVNPTTLLVNNVVEDSWICEKGAQIGITESNFRYANGVHVEATDDTLTFRQFGSLNADDRVLSPGLVERFFDAFDADNWFGITLEFGARLAVPSESPWSLASLWDRIGERLVYQDVAPNYSWSASFRLADRNISVNVSRGPTRQQSYILCSGSVQRNLDGNAGEDPGDRLRQICADWASDWTDVVSIATKLVHANLPVGGMQ